MKFTATLSAGVGAGFQLSGSASGKVSECEDDTCIKYGLTGTMPLKVGAKAELKASIPSCEPGPDLSDEDCLKVAGVGGGGDISVSSSATISIGGTKFCDDACGEVSGNIGETRVTGDLGFEVKLLDLLKYEGEVGFNEKIADGGTITPFGSCP